ncbi:MAG: trans-2-enoyl-CoA reductase family protein [Fibrobacter sp.]|jgi:enoyl-[acyl-carrier protein] reductase/trans-2-enoyl-CoA reductase (NAD+)|nr:trans-2-enoyl-CoA reductase family protein [Fibrobacter sp.]
MIIKPLIRSNICLNAHPKGCAKEVQRQIQYVQSQGKKRTSPVNAPQNVLVLGCSTGYGLASRITAAFQYKATTIGVSFEKEGREKKSGTPGWYNNMAFDEAAKNEGLSSVTFNGDAFSDEMRAKVIQQAKEMGIQFDLVVYSVASAVRIDPESGEMYRSVLKPFGKSFVGQNIDVATDKLITISAETATPEEAEQTVKVMGGEDWQRWIEQLKNAGVLAKGLKTIAYSYIGPSLSHAIYRDGTIGRAKEHLESTADILQEKLAPLNGEAYVSVNKGLVTRSSAVIPVIPLYLSILFKIMKEKGTHEGCIEQAERLFAERLYVSGQVPVDENRLIRIDDWELDPEIQKYVSERMPLINEENLAELGDLEGYKHDFLVTNGFDVEGVDYNEPVERLDQI